MQDIFSVGPISHSQNKNYIKYIPEEKTYFDYVFIGVFFLYKSILDIDGIAHYVTKQV